MVHISVGYIIVHKLQIPSSANNSNIANEAHRFNIIISETFLSCKKSPILEHIQNRQTVVS